MAGGTHLMLDTQMMIDLAKEFSTHPSGRDDDDGTYNGTRFREQILVPAIKRLQPGEQIIINIDGVRAFGSSFLEEAFAGLIRTRSLTPADAKKIISIQTSKPHLRFYQDAIQRLLKDAQPA